MGVVIRSSIRIVRGRATARCSGGSPSARLPGMGALDDVPYWCEMAEAIAWRETIAAVQESGDTTLGAEWAEVGGAVAFGLRGLDNPFFNRTVGLGIARPATPADVAHVDRFYLALGREWSTVQVAPH